MISDATLSAATGAKKGGIFGGKGKINDPFFMGPAPGPATEELGMVSILIQYCRNLTIPRYFPEIY